MQERQKNRQGDTNSPGVLIGIHGRCHYYSTIEDVRDGVPRPRHKYAPEPARQHARCSEECILQNPGRAHFTYEGSDESDERTDCCSYTRQSDAVHDDHGCGDGKHADVLLRLRFRLQLDLPFRQFNREFDILAAILFANLVGLFLHEG
jgi:hypothetical protein